MKRNRRTNRLGLTLIELVVVMVILVALAGILIPLDAQHDDQAHTTTGATNGAEISKMLQMFNTQFLHYPNNLDDVGGGTGTLVGTVPGATSGDYVTITLTGDTLQTLSGSFGTTANPGMRVLPVSSTTSSTMAPNWSPTFFPYATTLSSPLALSTPVTTNSALVGITPTAIVREFGINLASNNGAVTSVAQFVVLGLGKYSEMAGSVLQEAPVHFDDSAAGTPSSVYARFGLVFQIADDNGNALDSAKFIGAMEFMSDGIETAGDHLQEFYNIR